MKRFHVHLHVGDLDKSIAWEHFHTLGNIPLVTHWGAPDPAAVEGDDDRKLKAFLDTAFIMKRRIKLFLALTMATLDKIALQQATREIGTK